MSLKLMAICASESRRWEIKGTSVPCGAWGKAPHKAPHVLFPPYITNPSPRASMTIRLTAMETEFVKLASAVSLWQRSV